MAGDEQFLARKRQLRDEFGRRRAAQSEKLRCSRQICHGLLALPDYQRAGLLAIYVALPAEVQTQELITRAWSDGKQVAVPCCVGNELHLFHLTSLAELAPRTLGILEPRAELWQSEARWLDVARVDLFVVPGIAFDRAGGRLGYGKGYYDRLLARTRQDAPKIAVAFACQVAEQVPMTARDVFMDCLITEDMICRRDNPAGRELPQ